MELTKGRKAQIRKAWTVSQRAQGIEQLFSQAIFLLSFFFIVQYLLAELKSQVEAAVGKIPLSLHNYADVLRDIT